MKFEIKFLKKMLSIKFHSQPIYDEIYIKTKVKTFNDETDLSDNNAINF